MKFGKEFQQILDDPKFPDEWRSSAIEYRQLKKLIKDVVGELSSMGLSPHVLHKLLITDHPQPDSSTNMSPSPFATTAPTSTIEEMTADDEVFEFEFESEEGSPSTAIVHQTVRHSPKEVFLDPIADSAEVDCSGPPPISSSPNPGGSLSHHKFRLRLLSESSSPASPYLSSPSSPRPMGVTDMLQSSDIELNSPDPADTHRHGRKVVKRVFNEDVRAEYVLATDADHVVPQILLHVAHHSAIPPSTPHSPRSTSSLAQLESSRESTEDEEEEFVSYPPPSISPTDPRTPKALRPPGIDVIPPSPTLVKMRNVPSPIWAMTSNGDTTGALNELSIGDSAVDSDDGPNDIEVPEISEPSSPGRDFIIPLQSDLAFFNLLTAALTTLTDFHLAQQVAFRKSVANLCVMISNSVQPGSSVQTLSTPLTPSTPITSPTTRISPTSRKASRKDLYAWREIFGLWIESQIFESSTERNRGERSIEEAEARLQAFADQVVKRGLGDRRTMKGKQIKKAWEEFLRLNVLLLDLKRFQTANVNAARKILKKHDKQTSLIASTNFSEFVRTTLSRHVNNDGNVNTWTFSETSLPHILLSSLTETLLPILPSLDDYACLICTSIAFKPIRLSCSHLFCVRCLVKMQREGKESCPLCRSKTVLLADKSCLDQEMMLFMKEWFPKEIKEKQKENEVESAKETVQDAGLDSRCVIA